MSTTLEFKWGVSRGRDTYGYNICSLYADGRKVTACNGGGYDMKGTSLGNFIAVRYADRLLALKPEDMPENSHWERADPPRRTCPECLTEFLLKLVNVPEDEADKLEPPTTFDYTCAIHGVETRADSNDGKRVDDGRYFYGLTFHDPDFDPGKAVIKEKPAFGEEADAGKTVEQLEAEGKSLGLDRYQAFYRASNKTPTENHRIPLIDGACGFSSVEKIMTAIGLSLEWIRTRSQKQELYTLHDTQG